MPITKNDIASLKQVSRSLPAVFERHENGLFYTMLGRDLKLTPLGRPDMEDDQWYLFEGEYFLGVNHFRRMKHAFENATKKGTLHDGILAVAQYESFIRNLKPTNNVLELPVKRDRDCEKPV
jgi:hypothetical protein